MAKYSIIHGIRVAKDFTPETFGRLTTLGPAFRMNKKYSIVCQCDCGKIVIVLAVSLRSANTLSCGCLREQMYQLGLKVATTKHGQTACGTATPEYTAWRRMKTRCLSKCSKDYGRYGKRGIKICDRWLGESGFQNFFADMGKKPSPQHSIDRIDNDGDYCPENCRWATPREQANNTRRTNKLNAFGKVQSLSEWAREFKMVRATIRNRMAKGKTLEQVLTDHSKL